MYIFTLSVKWRTETITGVVPLQSFADKYKNSSGDEIANVNFYAVRPEATRIR